MCLCIWREAPVVQDWCTFGRGLKQELVNLGNGGFIVLFKKPDLVPFGLSPLHFCKKLIKVYEVDKGRYQPHQPLSTFINQLVLALPG